jgi:hypothetical protein
VTREAGRPPDPPDEGDEADDARAASGLEPSAADEAEDRALRAPGADGVDRELDALQAVDGPRTVDAWRAYFDTLEGAALLEAGRAANGIRFVRTLGAEGLPPKDVHAVLSALARRFAAAGVAPPSGGLYDWAKLSRADV